MMGGGFRTVLLLLLASCLCSEGFVSIPRTATSFAVTKAAPSSSRPPSVATYDRSTQLWKIKSNLDDIQGTKPGIVILTIVMGICIWGFTIPPEIRRSTLCTDERCLANRERCWDCKTFGELKKEVETYYANGGGIKWDFSIDPNNPFLIENIGK